jgi:hypothetical protein
MRLQRIRAAVVLLSVEYPEYWVILLCVLAWASLLRIQLEGTRQQDLCAFHGGMNPSSSAIYATSSRAISALLLSLSNSAVHWLLMLSAMMLPLLLGSLRGVIARSLWPRRHRAISFVLIGYAIPWLVFGLGLEFALAATSPGVAQFLLVGCLLFAAAWQLTSAKRRNLIRCHPEAILAPTGWKADRACLQYGLVLAGRCWLNCWALMIACGAGGHAFWATLVITAVVWTERFRPAIAPRWSAAALGGAALLAWTRIPG